MSTNASWHDKLLGGFKRTSDRLVGNLAGLGLARFDEATLDEIEEALIASDLGPETAARIRGRLAEGSYERDMERSEEHTSELQSLMRISYAVFCLKKKRKEIGRDNVSTPVHNAKHVISILPDSQQQQQYNKKSIKT